MVLTPLEVALLGGAFITIGSILGHYLGSNRCTKCGIDGLRMDIRVQYFIARALAERSGLKQDELLEIETMARQQQTGGHRL